ncbi:hypothetical protein DV738_g2707, partial [Chaetothyriales sp. CBS 135597]
MGAAGRVVCIATPFLLSLGALVTLVLIFLAGTMEKNSAVDDFYFLKIDLTNLTVADSSSSSSSSLGTALETAKASLGVQDYYTLYLRSSCSWDQDESNYTNCTAPKSFWYFDPVSEWSLNDTTAAVSTQVDEDLLSTSLRASLSTYRTASKALFVLYTATLAAVAASLLIGFFAVFSRWGSFFTTLFASAAAALFIGASGLATALFAILRTALNHNLRDDYGVVASLGSRWLPFTRAEKTPYTYERVGSPYLGVREPQSHTTQSSGGGAADGQNVPLYQYSTGTTTHYPHQHPPATAYEPYRHQQEV